MKEFDEIENLFSSAFDGAEMTPPPSVKEAVDASLFNNPKGGGFFWGYGILLIAFISGGFIAYHATHLDLETNSEVSMLQSQDIDLDKNNGPIKLALTDSKYNNEKSHQHNITEGLNADNSTTDINNREDVQVGSNYRMINENEIKDQNNSDSKASLTSKANDADLNNVISADDNLTSTKSNFIGKGSNSEDNLGSAVKSRKDNDVISKQNNTGESQFITDNQAQTSQDILATKTIEATVEEVSQLNYLQRSSLDLFPLIDRDTLLHIDQGGPMVFKAPNKWSLMLYTGGQGAFNTVQSNTANSTYRVQELGGIDLALETDYIISRRLSLGGGIDFTQRKTKLRDSYSMTDSVISGGQWVINNPSQPDTLQDSTFFATYDVTTTQSVYESLTRQTSVGIPIYVSYTIPMNSRLNFRIAAGARVSYESYKVSFEDVGLPATILSQFGVNAMLRPEVIYNFNRFGVGVYGKMTYDFKHGINWDAIDRKRFGLGGGVALRFKL